MKKVTLFLAVCSLMRVTAFAAGSEAIIKQRAKDLSNQNNARQGVAPPSQPAPAPRPATPAQAVVTPQSRLQADLIAIKADSPVTATQKQQLARDLMALAQGPTKPGFAAVNKLAEDLANALAKKPLSEGSRSRLLQDLNAAFNPGAIQPAQMQEIIADVQAIFESNGLARKEALLIADDLKAVVAEMQRPAAK